MASCYRSLSKLTLSFLKSTITKTKLSNPTSLLHIPGASLTLPRQTLNPTSQTHFSFFYQQHFLIVGPPREEGVCSAGRGLCSGGFVTGSLIAPGKKRRGDGCNGFCAGAAKRVGRWCNGRGDHQWELAWVSQHGRQFLYLRSIWRRRPPKRCCFDVRSIKTTSF